GRLSDRVRVVQARLQHGFALHGTRFAYPTDDIAQGTRRQSFRLVDAVSCAELGGEKRGRRLDELEAAAACDALLVGEARKEVAITASGREPEGARAQLQIRLNVGGGVLLRAHVAGAGVE